MIRGKWLSGVVWGLIGLIWLIGLLAGSWLIGWLMGLAYWLIG